MKYIVAVLIVLVTLDGLSTDASPSSVSGDISIPSDTASEKVSNNETDMVVQGNFAITEKTISDAIVPTDASLSISDGTWEAKLSRMNWDNVQKGEENPFTVTVTIPKDATLGMRSSYTLYLVFTDGFGNEVGSTQEDFMVRVDKVVNGDDDDDTIDDEGVKITEDKSIPFIPIFLGGVILALIVGLIWFFKNYEVVREVDGDRKIYLREKDTGRILGRSGRRSP